MSQWTDRLINPRAITGLYDGPPPLEDFQLQELRLEERGPDCFIRGVLSCFPDHPRVNWPPEAQRLQIRLSLSAVEDINVSGRVGAGIVDLKIERAEDGFGVAIKAEGDDVEFEVFGIALQLIGMKPLVGGQ